MSSDTADKKCLACKQGPDSVPLITLDYLDTTFWICPAHLPMLIHDPQQLIGKLPGAENLTPSDHHD